MFDLEKYSAIAETAEETSLGWSDVADVPSMYYHYRKEHGDTECVDQFMEDIIIPMYPDYDVYEIWTWVGTTEEMLEENGDICEKNNVSDTEWEKIKKEISA